MYNRETAIAFLKWVTDPIEVPHGLNPHRIELPDVPIFTTRFKRVPPANPDNQEGWIEQFPYFTSDDSQRILTSDELFAEFEERGIGICITADGHTLKDKDVYYKVINGGEWVRGRRWEQGRQFAFPFKPYKDRFHGPKDTKHSPTNIGGHPGILRFKTLETAEDYCLQFSR